MKPVFECGWRKLDDGGLLSSIQFRQLGLEIFPALFGGSQGRLERREVAPCNRPRAVGDLPFDLRECLPLEPGMLAAQSCWGS